ncbi:MAG: hypothetical protein OXR73_23095 [Myxococcales bacterium]|nr:hypothetical protein [Myxococcales bacterium]
MSLDLHVSSNAKAAEREFPKVRLSDADHERLFQPAEESCYPLLSRMSDYYSDATYQAGEMEPLLEEVRRLRTAANPPVADVLDKLIKALETGIREGKCLFCFAD